MKVTYDKDIDYAEIFFEKTENYGVDIQEGIVAFKSETNDAIVGYSFENASETVFEFKDLPLRAKIAFELKRSREVSGLSQEQVIKRLHEVSGRQYQRAEAGENITINLLEDISLALPEADIAKVFAHNKEA